jgi:hypothetical protein
VIKRRLLSTGFWSGVKSRRAPQLSCGVQSSAPQQIQYKYYVNITPSPKISDWLQKIQANSAENTSSATLCQFLRKSGTKPRTWALGWDYKHESWGWGSIKHAN